MEQVVDTLDASCVLVVLQGVLCAPLLILISHLLARPGLSQSVFRMGDYTLQTVEYGLVDLAHGDVLAVGGLDGDGPRKIGGYESQFGLVRLGGGQIYGAVHLLQGPCGRPEDLPDFGAARGLTEEGVDGVLGEGSELGWKLLICGRVNQIRSFVTR